MSQLTARLMSFTYQKKNSKGPKIDPYDTLQ